MSIVENPDSNGVLVAVRTDCGGKRRRLIRVVLNRVQSRQCRRVCSDDVDVLAEVVHTAVYVVAHAVHALICVPECTAKLILYTQGVEMGQDIIVLGT